MIKHIIATILLLSTCVSANIVISQVLYDPIGTESGGEAIELKNSGQTTMDLSNWVISTEASATDVKIPQGTIIEGKNTLLIADSGWSTKRDNDEWKDADIEDTMTLGNADSGIALKDENGTIVDVLGWGEEEEIEDGLWQGVPASLVAQGKSLLKTDNTGDNSEDFIESEPNFFDGVPVLIETDITITAPVVEVSDKLELAPESFLVVKNNRDSVIAVELFFSDLFSGSNVIEKDNIDVEDDAFAVQPGEEKKIKVSLKEVNAPNGKYTSILRVKIS